MRKIIIFVIGFCLIFSLNVNSKIFGRDTNLVDIIVFKNFSYKQLKDDFLKQVGIDINYVTILNHANKEVNESNYKEILTNFHNELIYDYKDVFGKKVIKNRNVYILPEDEFKNSLNIDDKIKISSVSVDTVYNDTSANKILVGKIYSSPKLDDNKDCYIIKLDRNNGIIWGKLFEDSKINRFNKIIGILDNEYYVIGSGYRESDWTDGFIARFDSDGNQIWSDFYGSSHIDDFKDVVSIGDGEVVVLAEVSNQDGDVKTTISINNPLNKDLVLLKYNSNGEIVWQNSIVNEKDLSGLKIINNSDNIVVVGEVFNCNNFDKQRDIILSTFDLDGKMKLCTIINDCDENMLNKLY